MLCRRVSILRMTASASASSSSSSYTAGKSGSVFSPASPYEVLGVTKSASFSEIRSRYQELTRCYHPDMPNGDPVKFREINAAYRVLRAAQREKKVESMDSSRFRTDHNQKTRGDYYSSSKVRWGERGNAFAEKGWRSSYIREMMWFYEGYELAIVLGAAVAVLVIAADRYLLVQRLTREKRARLRAMDEGLPPNMPLVIDDDMAQRYRDRVPPEEIAVDKAMVKEEIYHRRATQRRFEDFREFLFVYDPDGVSSRKVTTDRFSIQYVDEDLIPKQCPHVWEFNSEVKNERYENKLRDVVESLAETQWAAPDAQYIIPLVAKGLASIPMNSPDTAKWTFVEYKDNDKNEGPACLMALKNNRFGTLGMCQRVTVTGSSELSPKLVKRREADLQSGAVNKKKLLQGGKLPVKNLSIPLENMKL